MLFEIFKNVFGAVCNAISTACNAIYDFDTMSELRYVSTIITLVAILFITGWLLNIALKRNMLAENFSKVAVILAIASIIFWPLALPFVVIFVVASIITATSHKLYKKLPTVSFRKVE